MWCYSARVITQWCALSHHRHAQMLSHTCQLPRALVKQELSKFRVQTLIKTEVQPGRAPEVTHPAAEKCATRRRHSQVLGHLVEALRGAVKSSTGSFRLQEANEVGSASLLSGSAHSTESIEPGFLSPIALRDVKGRVSLFSGKRRLSC